MGGSKTPRLAPVLTLGLLGLLACQGSGSDENRRRKAPLPAIRGERIQIPRSIELSTLRRLEDARSLGGGELLALLTDLDPTLRENAATALGRFSRAEAGADVTAALCRALEDPVPAVRAASAFALGRRADPSAAPVLLAFWNDPEPSVRARIVEAASKVDEPSIREATLRAMNDPALEVAIEAVVAPHRWSPEDPDAMRVDSALLTRLAPDRDSGEAADPELVWRALFSLARRGSTRGRAAFLTQIDSPDPRARLFAAMGLAGLEPDRETDEALARALSDEDWRVVVEATRGLTTHARDPQVWEKVIEHPSAHVRLAAMQGLGELDPTASPSLNAVWRGLKDVSTAVRAEALVSLARLEPGEARREVLQGFRDQDVVVRAGSARAAAYLEPEVALPELERALRDEDAMVRYAAVEGIGAFESNRARLLLYDALGHADNGVRLGAVLALAAAPRAEDLDHLGRSVRSARGDVSAEIAFNAARSLGAIGGEGARELLTALARHPDPYVREVAREVLAESFPDDPPPAPVAPVAASAGSAVAEVPEEAFRRQRNPMLELSTTKGALVFELFAAEAPLHVHNAVTLAKAGHYDGLRWHRVVPDFVVQGGDHRGDGNGALDWREGALRHEVGPRKYVRGSLGMPRNEDWNSGGCQVFVTHRPTPHLDGRYTNFGELRLGFEVLDRLEVGDRILGARVF